MSKVQIPALFLYVPANMTKQLRYWGVDRTKETSDAAMNEIHFGKMISTELRKQRYSVAWFAKEMGSDRSNMYRLLERQHLNSEFILRAGKLLNHDFFGDASHLFLNNSTD